MSHNSYTFELSGELTSLDSEVASHVSQPTIQIAHVRPHSRTTITASPSPTTPLPTLSRHARVAGLSPRLPRIATALPARTVQTGNLLQPPTPAFHGSTIHESTEVSPLPGVVTPLVPPTPSTPSKSFGSTVPMLQSDAPPIQSATYTVAESRWSAAALLSRGVRARAGVGVLGELGWALPWVWERVWAEEAALVRGSGSVETAGAVNRQDRQSVVEGGCVAGVGQIGRLGDGPCRASDTRQDCDSVSSDAHGARDSTHRNAGAASSRGCGGGGMAEATAATAAKPPVWVTADGKGAGAVRARVAGRTRRHARAWVRRWAGAACDSMGALAQAEREVADAEAGQVTAGREGEGSAWVCGVQVLGAEGEEDEGWTWREGTINPVDARGRDGDGEDIGDGIDGVCGSARVHCVQQWLGVRAYVSTHTDCDNDTGATHSRTRDGTTGARRPRSGGVGKAAGDVGASADAAVGASEAEFKGVGDDVDGANATGAATAAAGSYRTTIPAAVGNAGAISDTGGVAATTVGGDASPARDTTRSARSTTALASGNTAPASDNKAGGSPSVGTAGDACSGGRVTSVARQGYARKTGAVHEDATSAGQRPAESSGRRACSHGMVGSGAGAVASANGCVGELSVGGLCGCGCGDYGDAQCVCVWLRRACEGVRRGGVWEWMRPRARVSGRECEGKAEAGREGDSDGGLTVEGGDDHNVHGSVRDGAGSGEGVCVRLGCLGCMGDGACVCMAVWGGAPAVHNEQGARGEARAAATTAGAGADVCDDTVGVAGQHGAAEGKEEGDEKGGERAGDWLPAEAITARDLRTSMWTRACMCRGLCARVRRARVVPLAVRVASDEDDTRIDVGVAAGASASVSASVGGGGGAGVGLGAGGVQGAAVDARGSLWRVCGVCVLVEFCHPLHAYSTAVHAADTHTANTTHVRAHTAINACPTSDAQVSAAEVMAEVASGNLHVGGGCPCPVAVCGATPGPSISLLSTCSCLPSPGFLAHALAISQLLDAYLCATAAPAALLRLYQRVHAVYTLCSNRPIQPSEVLHRDKFGSNAVLISDSTPCGNNAPRSGALLADLSSQLPTATITAASAVAAATKHVPSAPTPRAPPPLAVTAPAAASVPSLAVPVPPPTPHPLPPFPASLARALTALPLALLLSAPALAALAALARAPTSHAHRAAAHLLTVLTAVLTTSSTAFPALVALPLAARATALCAALSLLSVSPPNRAAYTGAQPLPLLLPSLLPLLLHSVPRLFSTQNTAAARSSASTTAAATAPTAALTTAGAAVTPAPLTATTSQVGAGVSATVGAGIGVGAVHPLALLTALTAGAPASHAPPTHALAPPMSSPQVPLSSLALSPLPALTLALAALSAPSDPRASDALATPLRLLTHRHRHLLLLPHTHAYSLLPSSCSPCALPALVSPSLLFFLFAFLPRANAALALALDSYASSPSPALLPHCPPALRRVALRVPTLASALAPADLLAPVVGRQPPHTPSCSSAPPRPSLPPWALTIVLCAAIARVPRLTCGQLARAVVLVHADLTAEPGDGAATSSNTLTPLPSVNVHPATTAAPLSGPRTGAQAPTADVSTAHLPHASPTSAAPTPDWLRPVPEHVLRGALVALGLLAGNAEYATAANAGAATRTGGAACSDATYNRTDTHAAADDSSGGAGVACVCSDRGADKAVALPAVAVGPHVPERASGSPTHACLSPLHRRSASHLSPSTTPCPSTPSSPRRTSSIDGPPLPRLSLPSGLFRAGAVVGSYGKYSHYRTFVPAAHASVCVEVMVAMLCEGSDDEDGNADGGLPGENGPACAECGDGSGGQGDWVDAGDTARKRRRGHEACVAADAGCAAHLHSCDGHSRAAEAVGADRGGAVGTGRRSSGGGAEDIDEDVDGALPWLLAALGPPRHVRVCGCRCRTDPGGASAADECDRGDAGEHSSLPSTASTSTTTAASLARLPTLLTVPRIPRSVHPALRTYTLLAGLAYHAHPFEDGNGRVARVLANAVSARSGGGWVLREGDKVVGVDEIARRMASAGAEDA